MLSGSRHEFYLKNMLSWIIIDFIVTVMHAKSHLYTENILFLFSYMDWAECLDKTFRRLQDMIKLPWVLSKCLPLGSPLQDWCTHSPAAQSYWLLTTKAGSLVRTWPWLKGFCIPGQRSFPRAAWILWLVNVGLQRPGLLPSIQGHSEGSSQSQNSPNKIIDEGLCVTASQCSYFLCPVLLSYFLTGFVLNVQFNKLPAFPFPSQSLFRKPDLRQIRSFSLQLVMKILSHFGIFHHVIFINQAINKYWLLGDTESAKHKNNKTKWKISMTFKLLVFLLLSRILYRDL